MLQISSKFIKVTALFLAVNLFVQTIGTSVAFALTSGPESPEFSSFTPVATSDMVDVFSGSFNYNIPVIEVPGPHGGGYAMSLAYNSGVTQDQEASWVGLGWTLNPGVISRSKQGFPDDFNGQKVVNYNKTKPAWSATGSATVGLEIFSKDTSPSGSSGSSGSSSGDGGSNSNEWANKKSRGGVDLRFTKNFHNYTGYHFSTGLGLGYSFAKLDINFDDNGVTFRPSIDASKALGLMKKKSKKNDKQKEATAKPEVDKKEKNKKKVEWHSLKFQTQRAAAGFSTPSILGSALNAYVLDSPHIPRTGFSGQAMDGFAFNWSNSLQVNPAGPIGVELGLMGAMSANFIKPGERKKEYEVKGYLYTKDTIEKENIYLLDYSEERGEALGNFDKYLGIPLPNYDVFSVSGEGVMGSFHAYPKQIGHFAPNYVKSETDIYQLGLELGVGTTIQVGLDLGIGQQTTKTMSWFDGSHAIEGANNTYTEPNNQILYDFDKNNAFRFDGDLGGKAEYQTSKYIEPGKPEEAVSAELNTARVRKASIVPGFKFPYLEDRNVYRLNPTESISANNPQKSSFIDPVFDSEELLKEYHITKSNGATYRYDYPVYVKNETNINIDVRNSGDIENNTIVKSELKLIENGSGGYEIDDAAFSSDTHHKTVVGQINNHKYAKSFLLTGIETPSYIDAGPVGYDEQDFGGWTKFNYRKLYGEGKSNWYRYRIPYYGLTYQQNDISDTQDDLGAVSTGLKEVPYLESIETGTHIAYFITNKTDASAIHPSLVGSGESRNDEVGAVALSATNDPAATSKDAALGNTEVEYLEKIVLFKKNSTGDISNAVPLKTVRFAYDYSLVPETPNSKKIGAKNTGKLTLKRLWFEYNGIVEARISPYQFDYKYDHEKIVATAPTMYNGLFEHLSAISGSNEGQQNLPYKVGSNDSWGNRTPMREFRERDGINYPDQYQLHEKAYDPAAYHLKKITLPSGGEIHVQYEANDYAYVQNRHAMTMANIIPVNTADEFIINLKELGLFRTDFDEGTEGDIAYANAVNDLFELVERHFIDEGNRVFYKMLYGLKGQSLPTLDNCKSEYIKGYATVREVSLVDNSSAIKITMGEAGSNTGKRALIPREACVEFVVNQRQGKLERTDCIEPDLEAEFDAYIRNAANSGSKGDIAKKIPGMLRGLIDGIGEGYNYDKGSLCLTINKELSFIRMPVYKRKIAGGARIKRLLMFDGTGLETGGASLYGTEYSYTLEDGTSSGVATNEPPSSRDENPLYQPLDQLKQTKLNRWMVGENLEELEGPLGESLLPAASIGYQRVVVSNIYKGSSSPGHSIHTYHTAFDYPYDRTYALANDRADYTGNGVAATDIKDNRVKDRLNLGFGLINIGFNKLFAAQGYLFVQNNMHGKLKETATYAGPYQETNANPAVRLQNPTSFTRYEYFEPGEKVRIFSHASNGSIKEEWYVPGKEMEVARAGKKIKDSTIDFNLELDINIDLAPIKVYPSFFASLSISDNAIAAHSTTKIIRYPSIVKKVTSYQDGIVRATDYLGFNKQTGQALLTATTDSYHAKQIGETNHEGTIYNYSIPVAWLYPSLGPKSQNELNLNQLEGSAVQLTTYGKSPIDLSMPEDYSDESVKAYDLSQVLQASIQTYKQGWDESLVAQGVAEEYDIQGQTTAIGSFGDKYLPHKSYTYKAENLADEQVYNSGYYAIPTVPNWLNPDDAWLLVNENTLYSPHSEPLEERNALGIFSSARFGKAYGFNLPIMMANNAAYNQTFFTSFEELTDAETAGIAHAGKRSMALLGGSNYTFTMDGNGLTDGALMYAWINSGNATTVNPELAVNGSTVGIERQRVAEVGEWQLMKWVVGRAAIASGQNTVQLSNAETEVFYLDDVRFQPLKAQATCYVYDNASFKLLTQFDDQHFGLYYQYDQEGKLVRKQVETERGRMTIQETYYNTPKASR